MNSYSLLIGIVPLLLFVIVDSVAGLKSALLTTIIAAILEVIYSYMTFGELDSVSMISLILVIALSIVSFQKRSAMFIKMQPVILSTLFGMVLIGSYLINRPLLYTMMMKYGPKLAQSMGEQLQMMLESPIYHRLLKVSTPSIGVGLLFHAAATAYAALKMSNWWWIAIRGIGFYFFMIASYLFAQFVLL